MKRIFCMILMLICTLTLVGASAEEDSLAATLLDDYGSAQTSSGSVITELFDTSVPGGTLSYILCEDMYICEYYSADSVSYVWTEENGDAAANLTLALEAAENYFDDYSMFIFVVVGGDGSETLLLAPDYEGSQEGIYNSYAAFSNAAVELFFEYNPDVNLTDVAQDNTADDYPDPISAVLAEVYGTPLALDHSVFGELFDVNVPSGSLIYTLSGNEFICEYYYDGTAYDWSGEENTVNDNLEGALEAAEVFIDYYGAFILTLMGDDGDDIFMLIPSFDDEDTHERLFNDFDAFADAAREGFAEMFSDANAAEDATIGIIATPVLPDFNAFINGAAYEYEVDKDRNPDYIKYAYKWDYNEGALSEYLNLLEDNCHFTLRHSEQNWDAGNHEIYIFDFDGEASIDAFTLSDDDVEYIALIAGIDKDEAAYNDFVHNSASADLVITRDIYNKDNDFFTVYLSRDVEYADTGDRTAQSITPYAGSSGSSSGSSSSASVNCLYCNGSGRCTTCGGSGHIYRYASGGGNLKSGCTSCYGSGRCRSCNGTGRRG